MPPKKPKQIDPSIPLMDIEIEYEDELHDLLLVQALALVRGERRRQYGHIIRNWRRLRLMATVIFDLPKPATYTQLAYFLIAMKMCRELSVEHPTDDNNRDIAGFIQCLQDAKTKEEDERDQSASS